MKKIFYLIVIAAAVLLVSCGKSRSSEVKQAAKTASEGILGATGEELVYMMDDYDILNSSEEKLDELMEEKFRALGDDPSESDARKLMEEFDKKKAELEKKQDEFFQKFVDYIDQKKGQEVPTEIADGIPLKLVKPFTITGVPGNTMSIQFEAQVELTENRPAFNNFDLMAYPQYNPTIVLVDKDGKAISNPMYLSGKTLNDYHQFVAKGTQETLSISILIIDDLAAERLAAKKILICWDKPCGNHPEQYAAALNDEPVEESVDDDVDDQFVVDPTEGLMGSLPNGTTIFEGDMAGYPIVFTIYKNGDDVKATYKNVKYGTTMELGGESLPSMGGDINFFGSDNGTDWSFCLTGDAQKIRGTANDDEKQFKVTLHRK